MPKRWESLHRKSQAEKEPPSLSTPIPCADARFTVPQPWEGCSSNLFLESSSEGDSASSQNSFLHWPTERCSQSAWLEFKPPCPFSRPRISQDIVSLSQLGQPSVLFWECRVWVRQWEIGCEIRWGPSALHPRSQKIILVQLELWQAC